MLNLVFRVSDLGKQLLIGDKCSSEQKNLMYKKDIIDINNMLYEYKIALEEVISRIMGFTMGAH